MKKDKRIRKTEEALLEAYVELAKLRNPEKITVASLCRQADINRGTFYRHYQDLPDFLAAMDSWIVEDIITSILKNPPRTLGHLTTYMLDHAETVFTILERPGGLGLSAFYEAYYDLFTTRSPTVSEIPPGQRPLFYACFIEGIFALFRAWWRSGFAADKEEVKKLFFRIYTTGFASGQETMIPPSPELPPRNRVCS